MVMRSIDGDAFAGQQPLQVHVNVNLPNGLAEAVMLLLTRMTAAPAACPDVTTTETRTSPSPQPPPKTPDLGTAAGDADDKRDRTTGPVLSGQNTSKNESPIPDSPPPADVSVASVEFGPMDSLATVLSDFLIPEIMHTSADHRSKVAGVEKCLSKFLKRPATVADMKDQGLCNRWLSSLTLKPSTVNGRRKYARLIQVFLFGRSSASDISLRRQREPQTMPVAWTVDQVQKIIAACRDYPQTIRADGVEVHVGNRTLLALLLIYDTGIRIAALMKRKRADVVDGFLIVPANDQKSRKEQRFKLSAETLAAIKESPDVKGRLIPHAYYQDRPDKPMRDFLTKILKTAGLPTTCKHKWHCFRRVHATQLAKAVSSEAAQRALGHSSIETTKRYIDTTQLNQVTAIDSIPRPGNAAADG